MTGFVCMLLFSFTESTSMNVESVTFKWQPCPVLVITNNSIQNPSTMGNYIITNVNINGVDNPVEIESGNSQSFQGTSSYMNVTISFIGDGNQAIAEGDYFGYECNGELQRLVCTRSHTFDSGTESSHAFGCNDTKVN